MKRAAKLVLDNNEISDFSIRNITPEFNIHYSIPSKFITKQTRQKQEIKNDSPRKVTWGHAKPWKIFTVQEENILNSYVMRSSDSIFGLTPKEVRTLTYFFAVKNDIRILPSWVQNGMAGATGFGTSSKYTNIFL
jgi:hypothetical protein